MPSRQTGQKGRDEACLHDPTPREDFSAAEASTPEEIRSSLTAQVTGSVRWAESMDLLLSKGHRLFIELGPGKVLSGLMGRIDKDQEAEILAVEDQESLEVVADRLASLA